MSLEARVKSVLSGDTVVLAHVQNPGQERVLSLAYVSAPRLRREGDEAYGFQAREFLRELLVGKVIKFDVVYSIPTGAKREYGIIKLPGFDAQLPDISVQEGWCKVREEAGKRSDESEETAAFLARLRALESLAQDAGKGVWAGGDQGHIETSYELTDGAALVQRFKGQQLEGIIERILNGDRLVLPAKRTTADGKEQAGEPFGDEAYQFVESRLQQRKVKVSLLGVTPQGQLIATVLHPNGNIARFLLEQGLARCHDHHSTLLGGDMAGLRQAERSAKDARKGIFTNLAVPRATGRQEKKISITSIRQPKPSDPKQSPFSADAKEFLRKRIIGKHVKVTVNGKKPATEGFEEREVATVVQGNTDVGLALVEAGYASVIRHPEAQKEGRGMWNPKPPKAKQLVDYSENVQKAKLEVGVLQRSKRIPAVVDFVKSGSRFTVLVPRENAKLTLVLSGIRAPRSARGPGEAGEPFGQEAHDLANRRCLQRDVEIDVETIDKVGGFIGTLYVNKENFTKILLEEGLATVHAYSAEQSGHANEYFAAEERAKDARKGLWHDYDPNKEAAEAEAAEATHSNGGADTEDASARRKDYRDVTITHVDPATGRLKLQQIGQGTSALTELMSSFRAFHLDKANAKPLEGAPKAGDWVSAQFSEDGNWYRAKVRRNDRENKTAEVVYIDFGNSESLPWSSLRPLGRQFSGQKLRPQAVDAVFSFIQFPTSADYMADAVSFIGEQTFDRELAANVDYIDAEGTLYVTLLDGNSESLEQSINADIIREGLALVPRKLKAWERAASKTIENLRELQAEAQAERRGIWEYGDLTED
ncbi:hypothetical protein N7470_006096 [Penicillium chermesinum]|nr:hypothetical protein N7470_006096 [Penicillium chermesinum]